MKKLFKIDPLKSFTALPILWLFVITFSLLAGIIAVFITINSDLVYTPDYKGFNSLVEIYKVPLSILAIIITFVAILASIHRSIQTKEQILNTNRQNAFSNYYKHIEEFEKYMNSVIPEKVLIFENLRLTHRYLFPNAMSGDYSVNDSFLSEIQNEFTKCKLSLEEFNKDNRGLAHQLIYNILFSIDKVYSLLNFKLRRSGKRLNVEGNMITVPDQDLKSFMSEVKNNATILVQILSFDHLVSIPKSLNQITKINLSAVPYWDIFNKGNLEKFNLFSD